MAGAAVVGQSVAASNKLPFTHAAVLDAGVAEAPVSAAAAPVAVGLEVLVGAALEVGARSGRPPSPSSPPLCTPSNELGWPGVGFSGFSSIGPELSIAAAPVGPDLDRAPRAAVVGADSVIEPVLGSFEHSGGLGAGSISATGGDASPGPPQGQTQDQGSARSEFEPAQLRPGPGPAAADSGLGS